jgi:hypothetical protein
MISSPRWGEGCSPWERERAVGEQGEGVKAGETQAAETVAENRPILMDRL